MSDHAEINRDEMPFVAPCRKLSPWAPFRWMKLGIKDLLQAPQHSLAYGLTVALMIGIVCLLAWLIIVVVSLLLGVVTAFVGLIVIVPVIGYAAWHGYLETIDADEFPRHEVGITSIPRADSLVQDEATGES